MVELRRYTLRPGRREELIGLFDAEFVETQEAVGMAVLGRFRDLDDADRFVWLRGFADMEVRRRGLEAFYGGPVWAEHGPAANDTMVDSDDVLLLRLVGGGLVVDSSERAGVGAPGGFVAVTVWSFPVGEGEGPRLVRDRLVPVLEETGPCPWAVLVSEDAPNTFPRLPVRTGENVAAVVVSYADGDAHRRHWDAVGAHPAARGVLEKVRAAPVETYRLAPAGRSLLH
ncbi:NIPSNAP family protein [Nocardiopsis protaetiae]|uniref:NIPSNAP family protein n=1 Tax=Nocardiopsis protaetiae TaxID=3382270 RepID=UPI00387A951D